MTPKNECTPLTVHVISKKSSLLWRHLCIQIEFLKSDFKSHFFLSGANNLSDL